MRTASGIWTIPSTIELVRNASRLVEPDGLTRLLGAHVGSSLRVDRAIVLSRKGLEHPRFRVLRAHRWDEQSHSFEPIQTEPNRAGGRLATLLYRGQLVLDGAPTSLHDPSRDLLSGQLSIIGLPVFANG